MKIVVLGGTGLIGSKLVTRLSDRGHEAIAASPRLGVDAVTGEGLAAALEGAAVVVDVTNSRSFDYAPALEFFESSNRNLRVAEEAAGVGHHVALSVVGSDRLPESGYLRAKLSEEALIKSSPIPHSIVRATQFFEFIESIANDATVGETVHVAPVFFQPIAAEDVAEALARVSVAAPVNGTVEIAGPERAHLEVFVRRVLQAHHDRRAVVIDPRAPYFGAVPSEHSLVPEGDATLGEIRFEDWLRESAISDKAAA